MHARPEIVNEQLAAQRGYLMTYAKFKLHDTDLADDAVQETLIAAMNGKAQFAGRASLRTWLVAILRNKISDLLSTRHREVSVSAFETNAAAEGAVEDPFDTLGRWAPDAMPQAWGDPEVAMAQTEFLSVFEHCLAGIPERTRDVFVRREVLGEPIGEICKNLGITLSNCNVMLYRARMRLRPCLQKNWFEAQR